MASAIDGQKASHSAKAEKMRRTARIRHKAEKRVPLSKIIRLQERGQEEEAVQVGLQVWA